MDDPNIPDDEQLLRRIHKNWWVWDEKIAARRLSSAAFDNSRDSSGTSVFLASEASQEQVLQGYSDYGLAVLEAGSARAVNQGVRRVPIEFPPGHAQIEGEKTQRVKKSLASACEILKIPSVTAGLIALALGASTLGVSALNAQPGVSTPLALTHANVIDGVSANVQRNTTVLINKGRIERIGSDITLPAGAQVIDLRGRWIAPGMIDVHTHIASLNAARRALFSGVTTARSASTPAYQDISIRELAKAGQVLAPDMFASGVFITPNLGETVLADPKLGAYVNGVTSPEALRGVVRINLDHGVDWIKTRGTERAGLPDTDPRKQVYTESQLKAIVQEAATRNVPVMAHAHGDEGAYAAVAAGVRSIEHGTYMSDSTLQLMKTKGTWFVPTLSTIVDLTTPGGDYDDPVLLLRGLHMTPRLEETIRKAHAKGMKPTL